MRLFYRGRAVRAAVVLQLTLALAVSAPAVAQSANAFCQQNNPGSITCQVQNPTVTQHDTAYPQIQFLPGDTVQVTANGCVQTGGSGRTWKRYVNPSGDNSDHLYFGLVSIPGATNGLIRLSDAIDKTFEVPKNYAGDLALHLGYQDDEYGDNGYWGHDDGTENQCQNVGNASATVFIFRSGSATPGQTPSSTPSHLHLNIGEDPLIPGVLQLSEENWTVTASWIPGKSFSASGSHTTVDFPSTPTSDNNLVSIHLDFKATASGEINGADFAGVTTQAVGMPDPAKVHMDGTDYTVGYIASYQTGLDSAGKPLLVVAVTYEGGQAGKLTLTPGLALKEKSTASSNRLATSSQKAGAASTAKSGSATLQAKAVDPNLAIDKEKLMFSQARYRAVLEGKFGARFVGSQSWRKLPLSDMRPKAPGR